MANVVHGVIHGWTIELAGDPGVEDGQEVEVTIRAVSGPDARVEAILRTAGSMANDPEFEAVMGEVNRDRHAAHFRDLAG